MSQRVEMFNIMKVMPSQHEKILWKTFNDNMAFGKVFLTGDFCKSETPIFHYELSDALHAKSIKPLAIIVPRETAKSTYVRAKVIRDFCFAKKAEEWGWAKEREHLFFGWCADNQKKSIRNVGSIRFHLINNPKLIYFFGRDGLLRGKIWNQEEITTIYGDRLLSSSNLTSMRGDSTETLEEGAIRYSNVFADDFENEKNTITDLSRDRIKDNIFNGIQPAVIKNVPGKYMCIIGTPVHFDSLIQNLLDKWALAVKEAGGSDSLRWTRDPVELAARKKAADGFAWRVIAYRSTQPELDGGVLWSSYRPRVVLDQIKGVYKVRDIRGIAGYHQEYELEVQSTATATWTRAHIKYHDGRYLHKDGFNYIVINKQMIPINVFIGVDPATDIDTKDTDFSVLCVIGVSAAMDYYVLEYVRERNIPTMAARDPSGEIIDKKGVVDHLIDLYLKYHADSATVEDVAMNRSVFTDLNVERVRRKCDDIGVIPAPPGGQHKRTRIYSGINVIFANGSFYCLTEHYALIDEIIKFGPRMAHDDTIEAFYYATKNAYAPDVGDSVASTPDKKNSIIDGFNWRAGVTQLTGCRDIREKYW